MSVLSQPQSILKNWVLPVLTITLFFCLRFLCDRNMGAVNELHHLPLARHFVDPSWLAQDIYYSEPPGYRLLFQLLFGPLTVTIGFLATSILGRILGYLAIAVGLWTLARSLGLRLLTLLVAIGLFFYVRGPQGVMAGEWLIGGIEPKIFAYGAIFMALHAMLFGRYLWLTAWLGLAASFHALVGGWTSIAVLVWLGWRRFDVLSDGRRWLAAIPIYGLTSIFALIAVLTQLLSPVEDSTISPAYIYSFLRNPHHVNPMAWPAEEWHYLLATLVIFGGSAFYVLRSAVQKTPQGLPIATRRADFMCFVLCMLVPFGAGILAAPFDQNGQFLQYYPFRVGDIMLPLGTAFFLALALEKLVFRHRKGAIAIVLIILFGFGLEATRCYRGAIALQQFPSQEQGVNPPLQAAATWLKQHVPEGQPVVSPPVDLTALPWLSDHPSIAKFRFVPSASSADVQAWFERITDLGGGIDLLSYTDRRTDARRKIRSALTDAYNALDTEQMSRLMQKYQSDYAVTNVEQTLELPLLYENARYRIYGVG
ncbi:hypothetical protein [Leptothoe kymatousa]|uniref:Mannosyltransferase n=1 Tax=Leptothoe kymatousa TAU-MAC 1615 TaxID=2364775 RepID=A0ABS5Y0X0_9CYAN|nr:hypothetical protein [Leptothoe kymatousa]MBT9311487.1 hypothetical protein [Leptothoe kymatousa TAU-MAC 1615]